MATSPDDQQRAKRHIRLAPPPPMRMTERDGHVLDAVYRYRVLTQAQIHRLVFTQRGQAVVQRRLFLLYHNGYLARQFLPAIGGIVTSPILYLLDKRGGEYLLQHSAHDEVRWKARDNQVSHDYLAHLLAINTFRVEVELACRQHQLPLLDWQDDYTLKQNYDRVYIPGNATPVAVIPDGYFQIQTPKGEMHFFLELDRGTMVTRRFQNKVRAYLAYRDSGLSKQHFNTVNYRVLTVTLSQERAKRLRRATAAINASKLFLFAVLDDFLAGDVLSDAHWWAPQATSPTPLINQLTKPKE